AEVRFRDPQLVRALLITSLQQALAREGQRAATTGGSATVAALRPSPALGGNRGWDWRRSPARPDPRVTPWPTAGNTAVRLAEAPEEAFDVGAPPAATPPPTCDTPPAPRD